MKNSKQSLESFLVRYPHITLEQLKETQQQLLYTIKNLELKRKDFKWRSPILGGIVVLTSYMYISNETALLLVTNAGALLLLVKDLIVRAPRNEMLMDLKVRLGEVNMLIEVKQNGGDEEDESVRS